MNNNNMGPTVTSQGEKVLNIYSMSTPMSTAGVPVSTTQPDQQQQHHHQQTQEQQQQGQTTGGRRPVNTSKRAAQNRAAQRAFRQRRDQYIKSLELKASRYEEMEGRLRQYHHRILMLEHENIELRRRLGLNTDLFPGRLHSDIVSLTTTYPPRLISVPPQEISLDHTAGRTTPIYTVPQPPPPAPSSAAQQQGPGVNHVYRVPPNPYISPTSPSKVRYSKAPATEVAPRNDSTVVSVAHPSSDHKYASQSGPAAPHYSVKLEALPRHASTSNSGGIPPEYRGKHHARGYGLGALPLVSRTPVMPPDPSGGTMERDPSAPPQAATPAHGSAEHEARMALEISSPDMDAAYQHGAHYPSHYQKHGYDYVRAPAPADSEGKNGVRTNGRYGSIHGHSTGITSQHVTAFSVPGRNTTPSVSSSGRASPTPQLSPLSPSQLPPPHSPRPRHQRDDSRVLPPILQIRPGYSGVDPGRPPPATSTGIDHRLLQQTVPPHYHNDANDARSAPPRPNVRRPWEE